jgi:hypothetical protein
VHATLEIATDQAAARPWARLGPAAVADLARVLTPIAQACSTASCGSADRGSVLSPAGNSRVSRGRRAAARDWSMTMLCMTRRQNARGLSTRDHHAASRCRLSW